MKCRLLDSFLLGFVLVTNALGDLSPRIFLGKIIISSSSLFYLQKDQTIRLSELIFKAVKAGLERKESEPEVTCTNLFVQKELSDKIGAAHIRRLGESNLMARKEPRKEDDALKKYTASLQMQMNDQKEHILEPKESKSINFAIPRSKFYDKNTVCLCLQYYNAKVADGGRLMKNPSRRAKRQMAEEHPEKKDEAKNLSKAANEIVNLTHEDYKGKANGKPPIHNHEPRN
ncbi:hypothetical protein K1719_008423 [Acacia pycnantha]|nr:hypothetical protein K1719_008423 [Acacia pycnantha]